VVAGDWAGADVGLAADVGVAHVGEVVGLGVVGDDAILDLYEVAQMHAGAEHGARTGAGVGPDHAGLAHGGAVDVAEGLDAGAGADAGVADDAVGADAHAVAELDLAFEHAVDVDLDVAAHGERAAHVDARGVDQGGALFHQAAGDVALVDALELGEL